MHRHFSFVSIALVSTVAVGGCASVLGLDDFTDAESGAASSSDAAASSSGSGGGGTGGASTSSATTGSGGAGGGSGGGALVGSCTNKGLAFDVFTSAELGGGALDAEHMVVVRGESDATYVAVYDDVTSKYYARAISDNANPLGSIGVYDGAGTSGKLVGGWVSGGKLRLFVAMNTGVGEISFDLTGGNDVSATGTLTPFATPGVCNNGINDASFWNASGIPTYAASCDDGGGVTLFTGTSNASDLMIVQSGVQDASAKVQFYAGTGVADGGDNLLLTGDNDPGPGQESFVRVGKTAGELAVAKPFVLDSSAGVSNLFFGLAPAEGPGVVTFAATLNLSPFSGGLWTGVISDYATLSQSPAPLDKVSTLSDINKVGPISPVAVGDFSLAATMTPFTTTSALLNWYTRDGKVLIFNQEVATAPAGAEILASGVSIGALDLILFVSWIERKAGVYSVRGQPLICSTSVGG